MYVYEPVRYAIVPISCNGMFDRKNCGNKYIPKYVYVVAKTFILCNYIRTKYKLCTVLCKKSFHQVRNRSQAVRDGSHTVHEPVLCIGINGYKRSFECYAQLCEQVRELLWAASWASSRSVMSSFVSTDLRELLWAASFPWLIFRFLLQFSSSSAIQLPSKETDNNTLY